MGDTRQRPNGSKPSPAPGISANEAQQLRSRIESLERLVREHLDEKNQWNSMVRGWVGTRVAILLVTEDEVVGELLWVDRYTMCLKVAITKDDNPEATPVLKTVIVHKAAIALMHQEGTVAAA